MLAGGNTWWSRDNFWQLGVALMPKNIKVRLRKILNLALIVGAITIALGTVIGVAVVVVILWALILRLGRPFEIDMFALGSLIFGDLVQRAFMLDEVVSIVHGWLVFVIPLKTSLFLEPLLEFRHSRLQGVAVEIANAALFADTFPANQGHIRVFGLILKNLCEFVVSDYCSITRMYLVLPPHVKTGSDERTVCQLTVQDR